MDDARVLRRVRAGWLPRWKIRVEGQEHGRAFYQPFWASIESLGRAIDVVLALARERGIRAPVARAALEMSSEDVFTVLHGESFATGSRRVRCGRRSWFPLEQSWTPPAGIIESCLSTDLATTKIAPGWWRGGSKEEGFDLQVVMDREQVELVLGCLLAAGDSMVHTCMVILVPAHRERRRHRARVTERPMPAGEVMRLLVEHRANLLDSGLVAICAMTHGGTVGVMFDECKVLTVHAGDSRLVDEAEARLRGIGIGPTAFAMTLGDVPHYHYRPPGSVPLRELWHLLDHVGLTAPYSFVRH